MCLGSSSSSSSISTIYQLDELEAVEPVEPVDSCPRNTDQEADARYPLLSSSSSPPPPPSPLSPRLCLCLRYIDPHHHALVIAPSIRSSPPTPLVHSLFDGRLVCPLSSHQSTLLWDERYILANSSLSSGLSILSGPVDLTLATRFPLGYLFALQPWLHAGSLAKR